MVRRGSPRLVAGGRRSPRRTSASGGRLFSFGYCNMPPVVGSAQPDLVVSRRGDVVLAERGWVPAGVEQRSSGEFTGGSREKPRVPLHQRMSFEHRDRAVVKSA